MDDKTITYKALKEALIAGVMAGMNHSANTDDGKLLAVMLAGITKCLGQIDETLDDRKLAAEVSLAVAAEVEKQVTTMSNSEMMDILKGWAK